MASRHILIAGLLFLLGGCTNGGGEGPHEPKDTAQDSAGDVLADVMTPPDTSADVPPADTTPEVTPDGVLPDVADVDVVEPLPELVTKAPLAKPADPLAETEIESCNLYRQERCVDGALQRCAIYDPAAEAWVDAPDPLLERAFLFDRWRDLYNSPDGMAVDRTFAGEVPPGTEESVWGAPEHFTAYWGAGDGGIWTGWSVVAAILRYAQTGTSADYARMEQHVRDLVTMYDVTEVPGYLCRYHFLHLPEGDANDPDHILRWGDGSNYDHHDRVIQDPAAIANLPAIYTDGVTDSEGTLWQGTPMWHGRPSIDQNTGPMTALPMAWDLLEDQELKDHIAHHLTCYLKRLQRIELVNLQDNPELLEGLMAYFNVGELQMDPDDIDLTKLEKVVGYVQRQINTANEGEFDRSCPDTIQLEPWRVIDATSDSFLGEMILLVGDMDTDAGGPNQLDHYYFPSIRGGDAMHLMHLATIAYHFTGDDMYREFLFEELIGNIDTIGVLHTAGAFNLPKWCKKYFGDQITFGPWWAFLHLLGDSPLRTEVAKAFHHEMWDKLVRVAGNVDFNIMYAGALPADIAVDKEEALAYALDGLQWMGGNGGLSQGSPDDPKWLQDPRRRYTNTPAELLAWVPDGVEAVCPTEAEVATCTAEIAVMGIPLGNLTGWSTNACTGSEWECEVLPDECIQKKASAPLPVHLRNYTDYLWQRNPFTLGANAGVEGGTQYAGSDYSVPYWNAQRYGFITEGAGQVLAWQPVGDCGGL